MEQDSNENGLTNLNPMFLWSFVMKKKGRKHPAYCFWGDAPESIFDLANNYPNCRIVIVQGERKIFNKNASNILVRNAKSFVDESEKCRLYSETDGMYCLDITESLRAGMCGVEVTDNYETFENIVKNNFVHSSVERIESWEKAKNALDLKIKH